MLSAVVSLFRDLRVKRSSRTRPLFVSALSASVSRTEPEAKNLETIYGLSLVHCALVMSSLTAPWLAGKKHQAQKDLACPRSILSTENVLFVLDGLGDVTANSIQAPDMFTYSHERRSTPWSISSRLS